MSTSAASRVLGETEPPRTSYIVLDSEDRIVHVSPDLYESLALWVGHVLWDHLPEASGIYGPCFAEARTTGRTVESLVYYAGRLKRLTAIPAVDGLAVHVERLGELDVTTLGTLTESLSQIEAALAGRASEPQDSRVPASLQALP